MRQTMNRLLGYGQRRAKWWQALTKPATKALILQVKWVKSLTRYYGAPEGFQIALDLIEDACDGLLLALKAEGNLPDESPQGVTRAS